MRTHETLVGWKRGLTVHYSKNALHVRCQMRGKRQSIIGDAIHYFKLGEGEYTSQKSGSLMMMLSAYLAPCFISELYYSCRMRKLDSQIMLCQYLPKMGNVPTYLQPIHSMVSRYLGVGEWCQHLNCCNLSSKRIY